MARPPKKPELRMGTDLRIPVTGRQKETIQQAAKLAQMDMATWARPVLLAEAKRQIAEHSSGK